MRAARQIGFGVAAAVAAAVLWWWMQPTAELGGASGAASGAGEATAALAPRADGADPGGAAASAASGARRRGDGAVGDPPVDGPGSAPAAPNRPQMSLDVKIPPSTRPFGSPEEASDFIEAKVFGLFGAVAPELERRNITRDCTPDGRECTFEGPWPGDDFMVRWLRAISDGRTGPDALDGVKFSKFGPTGDGANRHFVIVAHAP